MVLLWFFQSRNRDLASFLQQHAQANEQLHKQLNELVSRIYEKCDYMCKILMVGTENMALVAERALNQRSISQYSRNKCRLNWIDCNRLNISYVDIPIYDKGLHLGDMWWFIFASYAFIVKKEYNLYV